jgi:hypothetical protein
VYKEAAMKKTLAAALLILALLTSPAFGGVQLVTDLNDVEGTLDIGQLRFAHGKKYSFSITFYEKWKVKTLKAGNGGLNIYMDTAGHEDSAFNYYAIIVKDSSGLDCLAYNRGGKLVANGKAVKNGKQVTCKLPKKGIKRERSLFEWSIDANWQVDGDDYAHDYAPNDGFYTHIIPQG